MYLIIDSSDINSLFSIQLQNEWRTIWDEKHFSKFLVNKRIFDQNHSFLKFSQNSIATLRYIGLLKKKKKYVKTDFSNQG